MFNEIPDIFDDHSCEPDENISVVSEGRGDYFMVRLNNKDTEKALLERYTVLQRVRISIF